MSTPVHPPLELDSQPPVTFLTTVDDIDVYLCERNRHRITFAPAYFGVSSDGSIFGEYGGTFGRPFDSSTHFPDPVYEWIQAHYNLHYA